MIALYVAFGRSLSCVIYGLSYASRLSFVVSTFCSILSFDRTDNHQARFIPTYYSHSTTDAKYNGQRKWWNIIQQQRPKIYIYTSSSITVAAATVEATCIDHPRCTSSYEMANDEQLFFVVFINQHPMATQIKWNRHVSHPHFRPFRALKNRIKQRDMEKH